MEIPFDPEEPVLDVRPLHFIKQQLDFLHLQTRSSRIFFMSAGRWGQSEEIAGTWPATPAAVDERFIYTLKQIFEESILGEISNVLDDVHGSNESLQNRGHLPRQNFIQAQLSSARQFCRRRSTGYRGLRWLRITIESRLRIS